MLIYANIPLLAKQLIQDIRKPKTFTLSDGEQIRACLSKNRLIAMKATSPNIQNLRRYRVRLFCVGKEWEIRLEADDYSYHRYCKQRNYKSVVAVLREIARDVRYDFTLPF